MNRVLTKFIGLLLLLGLLVVTRSFAGLPTNTSLAPMLEKALPSVVNIRAQIRLPQFDMALAQRGQAGQGQIMPKALSVASGVIVDASKGYILTNAHVIDGAESVTVTLSDGRHYNAKIIGIDKPSDVAVLQIPVKNLTAIPLSDSNTLKVGDVVAAVGNPFGLSQTVTSGIVSALGRAALGIEGYENFIQTDAPINPGNSGGALINAQGQLVGINTAILAPDRGSIGIGFAIPSNMAKSVMLQLIQYGNVRRGTLGIGAQDITPELSDAFKLGNYKGAVVTEILPDTPAEKAGLQVGDVITKVNGANIKNANDVVNAIGSMRVDSKATLMLLRDHKPLTLSAIIISNEAHKEIKEEKDPFLYGVSLNNFALASSIHGDVIGVLVASVDEDSSAWHSDLRPGDVITAANQQRITNIDELRKVVASTKKELLLHVLRGGGAAFLVISKEDDDPVKTTNKDDKKKPAAE